MTRIQRDPNIITIIERLLHDEGAAVTIFSQNPEGSGPDNYAIEVSDGWCGYDPPQRFYGYTLLDALSKAEDARTRFSLNPSPLAGEGQGEGE